MKFTVVFPSHESKDLSFGYVFIPCPCWIRGEEILINLHPEYGEYRNGDFQKILDYMDYPELDEMNSKVILVIHPEGHGGESDLEQLVQEINSCGFGIEKFDRRLL